MKLRMFVATALLAAACTSQASVIYGNNLVVNGDAEAGVTGWTGDAGSSMFQAVNYGSNWVQPTQPGPVERGTGMFSGFSQYAAGYQSLDLGTATAQRISYSLTGWLGGWTSQEDNAQFRVQFLDELNNELGGASLGPVTAGDRDDRTGLQYRAVEGFMPTGTRKLAFWLSMERFFGIDNDGYADNLAFVLGAPVNEVPEPGMIATGVLGLGMLGWFRRRKQSTRRA